MYHPHALSRSVRAAKSGLRGVVLAASLFRLTELSASVQDYWGTCLGCYRATVVEDVPLVCIDLVHLRAFGLAPSLGDQH